VILLTLSSWVVDLGVTVMADAGVVLSQEQTAELRAVVNSRDVPAALGTRARIVWWRAGGRRRKDVAELAGVSLPTVDRWVERYAEDGLVGLEERKRGGPREQVPAGVPARILALTRTTPPPETGVSPWSSRQLAADLKRTQGVAVSWRYVARRWRDNDLTPHRSGTFQLRKDPRCAAKVAVLVGLYVPPPGGAVVLSIDEKTQIQAADRTQPLLPLDFGVSEQRTHDDQRHGITHLFAALDVNTGQVTAACHPDRTGQRFLAFLRQAVKPHAGKEIHVVLDLVSQRARVGLTPDDRWAVGVVGCWTTCSLTSCGGGWHR
jgi:transposase